MAIFAIGLADVRRARRAFEENEPRDLFYRAAADLVDRALTRSSSLTVCEALAVLLQTWNKTFYRFTKFDAAHFKAIEEVLKQNRAYLAKLRRESIEDLPLDRRKARILALYESFELVLGPVGTAKALHLLAPHVFPIWDRQIAKCYGFALEKRGSNGERYWRFMLDAQKQCIALRRQGFKGNALKAIDEWNYCSITTRWLPLKGSRARG